MAIAWPPKEFPVEEDIHEVKTNCTEAEKHGVISTLKLFTNYELKAGNEYWGNRIAKRYPRVCIQRMANAFANAELNMHAPFYNELNKALNLDTEEFYTSYKQDKVLQERMEFIDDCISSKDDLLSLAVFSMVEGAVLYSAFAFLKHFRTGGKNKFKNLISGINASVRDENLHAVGGAWLFNTHLEELGNNLDREELEENIYKAAEKILEHEKAIIAMLFEKGSIVGITPTQLEHFVESRLNICLNNLGYKNHWEVKYNPIADWFYDNINSLKLHDFFDTGGSDYSRNWNQQDFVIKW
jgi:ribonucleotide reductase beta subunit family protein with ferritin-like domain